MRTLGEYREYAAPVILKHIAVGRLCDDALLAELADAARALLRADQTTHIK